MVSCNVVYIDFDGVIYDTIHRLQTLTGKKIDKFDLKKHYDIDPKEIFAREDFYVNEEAYFIEDSIKYLRLIGSCGGLCILTKYTSKEEKKFKRAFINKYVKSAGVMIKFVPFKKSKQDYLTDGDFLIDDQCDNLEEGYTRNILFDSKGEYNLEWNSCDNFKFNRMYKWEDIYKYIKFISAMSKI